MTSLDPSDIVDRESESNRFESLLAFDSPRRVLTVSDDTGRGKSTFLQKLRFLCEWRYEVPVALVPLEEFDDRPDEFELAHDIVRQLKRAGVPFAAFDRLARARSLQNVQAFLKDVRSVQGTVDAGGASIDGSAQVAGVIFNVEHANNVAGMSWTDAADREAKELSLAAFFTELTEAARSGPVVVLFDTVDLATEDLQRWIFLQLLKRGVLATAGEHHKLLVVLAGNKLDARLRATFKDLYETFFEPIPTLGPWELQDTARMFEVHGYTGLDDSTVRQLHQDILDRRLSYARALAIAEIYRPRKEG